MLKSSSVINIPKKYISNNGVVLLPIEDFEKMKEDLEMYQSSALSDDINIARQEIKQGKTLTLDEMQKSLEN